MNTHDIELPQGYDARPWDYDGQMYTEGQMRAAIEADRKLHDRMLAHEWIRPSLGLDEDAPYRFDFYAQEIEKLKAELKKFGRNDNDNRKCRGDPVAWIRVAKKWDGEPVVVIAKPHQEGAKPVYSAPQPDEPVAWQPIETAPKDHTILVGREDSIIATARGTNEYGHWRTGPGHMDYIAGVTHWMPLPSPPKATQPTETCVSSMSDKSA